MPRYFFETIEDGRVGRDEGGLELNDDREARRMAWTCLGDLLWDMRSDPPTAPIVITVIDELRKPLYRVVSEGR